ncbi:hypothetical protein P7K49_028457 [Saguinus oedipus]|uniref:Uncharacterized protein n=1 Tax=Saguinus oedipus TaxID=9490 RepID=A0ABQ9UD26_SAGOE|nr:hypothetical protein P7K49_028457 [Saguinus oedipus]
MPITKCKFTCTSGKCLYLGSLVCNQQNDCGDNSDEENCLLVTEHPPPGIFNCPSSPEAQDSSGSLQAWDGPEALALGILLSAQNRAGCGKREEGCRSGRGTGSWDTLSVLGSEVEARWNLLNFQMSSNQLSFLSMPLALSVLHG